MTANTTVSNPANYAYSILPASSLIFCGILSLLMALLEKYFFTT